MAVIGVSDNEQSWQFTWCIISTVLIVDSFLCLFLIAAIFIGEIKIHS